MPEGQPNAKDALVSAVSFIFDEVDRVAKIIAEQGLEAVPVADHFCQLPLPQSPGRFVLCSHAADIKISELAYQAAKRAGIGQQVSQSLVAKCLGEVLARKFIMEKRKIELVQVERSLSEAARLARKMRRTITHYIPCHLMLVQSPECFSVGPIRFLNQKYFRSIFARALCRERHRTRRHVRMVRDIGSYYRSFGWIAEVTIPNCEQTVSETLAIRAATTALDCIHLLLGPAYSHKMRVGGPGLAHDRRGGLRLVDNKVQLRTSHSGLGHVGYEDDWFTIFDREDYANALNLCGLAIEAAVDPTIRRPLSNRFLDAVYWFGEAVRETSPAAKVVKYITALERMLMTDEADDITKLVSERVAAVCFDLPCQESFAKWNLDTKRAYALRSKLVHGSLSPTSPEVLSQLKTVALISQQGMQGGLALIGATGLIAPNVSTKQLANLYNGTVAHARRIFHS